MPTKMQSVPRSMPRVQRNPVASGNNESTVAHLPNGHSQDLHARIAELAYALYEAHGREEGHALEDWLEAERQVLLRG